MRITQNIMISNFLRNLNSISQRLERSQEQLATGKNFSRPSHGPIQVGQVIGFKSDIARLNQYLKNIDDGSSQTGFVDSLVQGVIEDIGRARDLALDAANDNLNAADRATIAQEINQILNSTVANANARFRDRFAFAGWNTRTNPFEAVYNSTTGLIEDIIYHGNRGYINRLVGDADHLTVNINGKSLFLEQTYTRRGKTLPENIPLGFSGKLKINDIEFEIKPTQTLRQIALMLNAKSDSTHVFANVDSGRLILESATAVSEFTLSDNKNNALLEDLGLHVTGAFNLGFQAPTLPLTDSTPAIFTAAGPVANLTYDNTNNTLNIFLGSDANGGISQAANIIISEGTYASVSDLINEIQSKIDGAFGKDKIIVSDSGGGVLQFETVATGDEIDATDLLIGGTINGLNDTASQSANLNLIAFAGTPPPTAAQVAGTDGNDKIIIDLGPSASKNGLDIVPQVIDIRASFTSNAADLVNEIEYQIFQNDYLRGAVKVSLSNGRILFETVKTGVDVKGLDFIISEGATGTISALGLSDIPKQAIAAGNPATPIFFPFLVIANVNDTVTIDLGPSISVDGTDPGPVTIKIPPGIYGNPPVPPFNILQVLQNAIQASPILNGAIVASQNGNTLTIASVKTGSDVRGEDLKLGGTLLPTLKLPATALSGGGSSDGRGVELDPNNIFNTLITLRDDNDGVAWKNTSLFNLRDSSGEPILLADGDIVKVTYDAGTFSFRMLSTDTLDDLVRNIQTALGSRARVSLSSDGRLMIKNLETFQIFNFSVTAESATSEPRSLFNALFSDMPDQIPGLTSIKSSSMRDQTRYQRLGDEDIAMLDFDLETLLKTEAIVGARANRLLTISSLFSASSINIDGLKNTIEAANYAEVVTRISQQELVFQSALMVGAKVLPPSLISFLV